VIATYLGHLSWHQCTDFKNPVTVESTEWLAAAPLSAAVRRKVQRLRACACSFGQAPGKLFPPDRFRVSSLGKNSHLATGTVRS
jgi:hypothetical protein